VAVAREIGDAGVLSHALNNIGIAYWRDGDPRGRTTLEESLAIALDANETEHACRAYISIAWNLVDELELHDADRLLRQATEMADQTEYLGYLRYMHVAQGRLELARGAWDAAVREAKWAVNGQPAARCQALVVIGRVRARRGQEGSGAMLSQAWEISLGLGEAQHIGPAASALIEAAWLRGDASVAASVVAPQYETVRRFGPAASSAELGYRMQTAGAEVTIDESDHPYALLAAGNWRLAAEVWRRAGCRTNTRLPLLRAMIRLTSSRRCGPSTPSAPTHSRAESGRSSVALESTAFPRGPVPSTRDNPAGLTERQVQVLAFIAKGLTNAEIATQLVLSTPYGRNSRHRGLEQARHSNPP
jgi:ATP/maltotriose-dependent transcriptional regulator MalT